MTSDVEKIVGGFRSAISDLLVSEMKAVQVELKHHTEQFVRMDKRFDALYLEMDRRFKKMDERFEKIDERFDALYREMDRRFEKVDERFEKVDERFKEVMSSLHSIEQTQAQMLEAQKWIMDKLTFKDELADYERRISEMEKRFQKLELQLQKAA